MTWVKICGMTREEDVDAAVASGADAVGVVVGAKSPRSVSVIRARDLLARPGIGGVLVMVPRDPDSVAEAAEVVGPDMVQLHGALGEGFVGELRSGLERRGMGEVGVAVSVGMGSRDRPAEALEACRSLEDRVDYIHLDSKADGMDGGTGRTHNWKASRWIREKVDCRVILAGGLNPGNVAEGIRAVEPFGVDVSSGVEVRPGVKDPGLVESFLAAARGH